MIFRAATLCLILLAQCRVPPLDEAPGAPSAAVDLSIGEEAKVELGDGSTAAVKLLGTEHAAYGSSPIVREARVTVEVNGERAVLVCGRYRLPVRAGGVQIDCPVTAGYVRTSKYDVWGLEKDARLRLWPGSSRWIGPWFAYPVRQRWFATDTQMANEPCYVNEPERFEGKIYYHFGLDIGGMEGKAEVVSATDGLVVAAGRDSLDGHPAVLSKPRRDFVRDTIYVLDEEGWYHRYSHVQTIEVRPGDRVKQRQRLGLLGKEGDSGGWAHLHYDITRRQPSGKWGIEEGYAYLWEAYLREHRPKLLAVARPHHATWAGDPVRLDGSLSWSASGKIERFEWSFTEGGKAEGPAVERTYSRPGTYSETLKIVDRDGRVGYDFAVVQVLPKDDPRARVPAIHATYFPTFGIRPGDEVTFGVRTFGTTDGEETWDFGDGSPPVRVKSDGNVRAWAKEGYALTSHRYGEPGHYLAKVERSTREGLKAVARLHVRVGRE